MLHRFKHMPLRQMIALIFILFSLLPTFLIIWYAYQTAAGEAQARVRAQVEQTAQHVDSELNMVIKEASRLMNYTSSYTISNFLNSKTATDRYEKAKAVGKVFDGIRQTQSSNSYILDMSVIGTNGHCFSERNGYFYLEQPFASYEQFETIVAHPRTVHIQGISLPLRDRPWEKNALTVSAAVFKISTNEVCGILRVTVSKSHVVNILENAKPSESGQTFVVDNTGSNLFFPEESTVLSKAEIRQILNDSGNGTVKTSRSLVVHRTLPSTGWTIISVAPNQEIFQAVYQLRVIALVMVIISLLLILIINIFLSKYIAHPILQLKALMQSATSGNLDVEIPQIDGQVEIMELYRSFDTMLSELKNLLNRVVTEQNNLKKSELRTLQSQINPHFLYNTLDSAVWAAESNNTDEVIDLITSLSSFYRLTLRSGMDVVSFDTEVHHVSYYLHIMQKRYRDILDYSIDVSPETLRARFPKIILQPIVENAIYHGIKNKRYAKGEKGMIQISAQETADHFLEVTVSDTGIGMDEAETQSLWEKIQEGIPRSGQSYGLINVNLRLRLMFGEQYTLRLASCPGSGTTIVIRVPLIEEDSNEL